MAAQSNFRHPERTEDEIWTKLLKQWRNDEVEIPPAVLRHAETQIAQSLQQITIHA